MADAQRFEYWDTPTLAECIRLMRAELRRRSLDCFIERRSGPRLGPEHRRGWDRLPAPTDQSVIMEGEA
jgi:hypothetical protein